MQAAARGERPLAAAPGGTQYPDPTDRTRERACRQIVIASRGQERTSQKEGRTLSESFSRSRGRLRATMGESRWPVGIYTGGPEGLESDQQEQARGPEESRSEDAKVFPADRRCD